MESSVEASVIIQGRNEKGLNQMKMKREQKYKTHCEVLRIHRI